MGQLRTNLCFRTYVNRGWC